MLGQVRDVCALHFITLSRALLLLYTPAATHLCGCTDITYMLCYKLVPKRYMRHLKYDYCVLNKIYKIRVQENKVNKYRSQFSIRRLKF